MGAQFEIFELFTALGDGVAWNPVARIAMFTSRKSAVQFKQKYPAWTVGYGRHLSLPVHVKLDV